MEKIKLNHYGKTARTCPGPGQKIEYAILLVVVSSKNLFLKKLSPSHLKNIDIAVTNPFIFILSVTNPFRNKEKDVPASTFF